MTGQTENKYFTETPNYTQVQQNKHAMIVAAEVVLTQTVTLMPPLDFSEKSINILILFLIKTWLTYLLTHSHPLTHSLAHSLIYLLI